MKSQIKKLEKSQIEIEVELDEKEFAAHMDRALDHLKAHVKMDGFRPGQVPKEMVEKRVGQESLLMEAGDMAVRDAYYALVKEHALDPIGEPEVQIVKIAKGSPLIFKVKVAVLPEISLPDYKDIMAGIKGQDIAVTEEEIEDALRYLQRSRAKFSPLDRAAEAKDFVEIEYQNEHINGGKAVKDRFILGEGGFMKDFEDNVAGMRPGQEKEFMAKFPENTPDKALAGKEGKFKVKMLSVQHMQLPEINDEFARALGVFDNMVGLRESLKDGIALEKTESEKQRKRGEVLNRIAEKVTFDLPEKMVRYEQERLLDNMKQQVLQNFKLPFEEYLSSIKKTEEEVKTSFQLEAERRAKNFLVLREIGRQERIEVSNEELESEMANVMKNYSKDQLVKIDMEELKEYTRGAIYNEKVFQKLESFSG